MHVTGWMRLLLTPCVRLLPSVMMRMMMTGWAVTMQNLTMQVISHVTI